MVGFRCTSMNAGGSVAAPWLVTEGGTAAARVVVVFPVTDDHSGLAQRPEAVDVQAFVADAGVERIDVAVAPRLAGGDEMQPDLCRIPVGHCPAGQFEAVVTPQHRRKGPALGGQAVELGDQVLAGDAALDHSAEAFAGALIDDRTI